MTMNELGFYALAGAPKTPKDLIEEVELAEHIGIGNCFYQSVSISKKRRL